MAATTGGAMFEPGTQGGEGIQGIIMTGGSAASRRRGSGLPAGSVVVRVRDLDIAAAPALRERLISMLRPGTRLLVLDLSHVLSCDPAGLAVLIGAQRRARPHGIVMRLVAPSRPVAELLHSTGLERWLTVCPDLAGALAQGSSEPAGVVAAPQALAG